MTAVEESRSKLTPLITARRRKVRRRVGAPALSVSSSSLQAVAPRASSCRRRGLIVAGAGSGQRALVARVEPDSPAARAGILRQDVIRSINGQTVYESSDLPPIIGAMAPGTRVSIEVIRDGKPRTVTATLNQLSEASASAVGGGDGMPRPGAAAQANPLGIIGEDLDPQQRSQLGLQPGEGVLVARVDGVAAREAGLRPGDVILAVGRNDVANAASLNAQLRASGAGKAVMLLVRRGGGTQYVTVNPDGE